MGGSSSKQTFATLVETLLKKSIDANDHEFWDELWRTVLSAEDIFDAIGPEDVRKMIDDEPDNVRIIFTQAVAQLYQVVETPYPIYFQQALNCARVLSRILPFLLESHSLKIKELLWNKRLVKSLQANAAESNGGQGSGEGQQGGGGNKGDYQESEPLAVILVNTLFHLLFLPEFTIEDPNVEFSENDIDSQAFKSALMWAPGLGSLEKSISSSTAYDGNRVEVLRLMIAAFCDALYQRADLYDSCASLWLEVATSVDAPYAEIVFCTLVNTVLGYDPLGYSLPYGRLLVTDTAKIVMEHSLQVLLILLDYGHPIRYAGINEGIVGLPCVAAEDSQAQGFNIFRRYLGTISQPDQLHFLYRGFVRLLNNIPESEAGGGGLSLLPYAAPRIDVEQALLILLWKCLEECPRFLPYVLRAGDVTQLLFPLCYLLLAGRKEASRIGLLYLGTFTLLKLSGERAFGVALNKPLPATLPALDGLAYFAGGCYGDLLVLTLHKLIVSGNEKLSALYSCFLTVLCNVSPYLKSLGNLAAIKLLNLVKLFTSPRFLYAHEGNHIYVGLLLESLNNLVQYQYEGNGHVVYGILRRREVFEGLASLTLEHAQQMARDQQQQQVQGGGAGGEGEETGAGAGQPKRKKTTTTAAAALPVKGEVEKKKEAIVAGLEEEEPGVTVPRLQPTDLISTQSIERKAAGGAGGEGGGGIKGEGGGLGSASSEDVKLGQLDGEGQGEEVKEEMEEAGTRGGGGGREQQQQQQQQTSSSASSSSSAASASQRFVPTEAWLAAVKSELPLNTILRLLKHLSPLIDELAASTHALDEKQVVDFIRSTTMVGLLPVPHPIVIRKYQPNRFTCLWFTAYMWGVIFMQNQGAVSLFDGRQVKLFLVQTL